MYVNTIPRFALPSFWPLLLPAPLITYPLQSSKKVSPPMGSLQLSLLISVEAGPSPSPMYQD